ncbi:MAG: hypothetical protein KKF89_06295 [Nanoarchaeota archaeon]|nr:hypothetical protein [Nanoarchaeota archaeon]
MSKKNKLVVFQDKKIRRIWRKNEWYFSVIDVVQALTDSNNPRNYWSMLKKREEDVGIELSTNCVQLKLVASDGKLRETDFKSSIINLCGKLLWSIIWITFSSPFLIHIVLKCFCFMFIISSVIIDYLKYLNFVIFRCFYCLKHFS